jgi:hypothetical protein
MYFDPAEKFGQVANQAEAHVEWHRNAGIPMGTPGCPWDACDIDDENDGRPEPIDDHSGNPQSFDTSDNRFPWCDEPPF